MRFWYSVLLFGGTSLGAWQFPQQQHMALPGYKPLTSADDDVDIVTGSQFNGLTTYANLPYLNCVSDDDVGDKKYDIAILGAPFDTGVTARPGARYGPKGIRVGSQRIAADTAWSVYTGKNPLLSWATIVDCGDVTLPWLDNNVALAKLDKAHKGLIRNTSIHAGIRAPIMREKGDMKNDVRCGFATVKARDLDRIGASGVISQIKERVGDSKVYISVDIDVLDPAFAPATGTPEPGGWSSRELLTILDGLNGLDIIGGDVVEVAPIYDTAGQTTALAAAEIAFSLLELMVDNPVKL
ncbi:hypothetical protein Daesc_009377 [Daldinia eschscholtzii]|uniref:Agmatinase n=1 Tax=Daldinia eschscholtzii TaxID=292717 RepID=A0AAX6MAT2_9PEZI